MITASELPEFQKSFDRSALILRISHYQNEVDYYHPLCGYSLEYLVSRLADYQRLLDR